MKTTNLNMPEKFDAERVLVRAYTTSDSQIFLEASLRNHKHLREFESGNVIYGVSALSEATEILVELQQLWQERKMFFMGIFLKETKEFVGQLFIGVSNIDLPEFAIGYFADLNHEGKGYISEAVKAALQVLFKDLKALKVRIHCNDTNLRSKKLAERCGFKLEGHIRCNKRRSDGSVTGDYYFGLLKEEFKDSI